MTETARRTFDDSFDTRHECKLCGVVEIPQDIPAKERRRMAEAARSAHYTRMSHRRAVMRGRAAKAKAAAETAEAELAELDDAI